MAPILPYLTDSAEMLDATVGAIAAAGATHVTPIVLHLRPGAREWYSGWLREHRADLVPLYRELYGDRSYAPMAYQSQIAKQVRALALKYNVGGGTAANPRQWRRAEEQSSPEPGTSGEQLTIC
jgi:DNA repair photolyase